MSIANNQTLAARIAPVGVLDQEAVDFRFDGCLEHLAGSFMNDRVQSTPRLKGLSELITSESIASFAHVLAGASTVVAVPCRMAYPCALWPLKSYFPQQDTPPFFISQRHDF